MPTGLFKRILVPISSEYFSLKAIKRAGELAEIFGSSIEIAYIIEEKTLKKIDEVAESVKTEYKREELKKEVAIEGNSIAYSVIFEEANKFFKKEPEKRVIEGEFTNVIIEEAKRKKITCVLMGFERKCILRYRLFEELPLPIWVEMEGGKKTIAGICSNLSPNKKVPRVTCSIAEALEYEPYIAYIVDTSDRVEVDKEGERSSKKPIDYLLQNGEKFVKKFKEKGIKTMVLDGPIEERIGEIADKLEAGLVVVGREKKRRKILGIFFKDVKREITEKTSHSLLFLK